MAMSLPIVRRAALDFRLTTDLFGWVSLVCTENYQDQ